MSWIFVNDRSVSANRNFPIDATQGSSNPNALLAQGSLTCEIDISAADDIPCRLVHFHSTDDWLRRFTIYLNADYSLSVEAQQGNARSYTRLPSIHQITPTSVRLTYSWDAPKQRGLLSLVDQENWPIVQATCQTPIPLPVKDAKRIVVGNADTKIHRRVKALAISDEVEAVGPVATIGAGAMIETATGNRAIESLKPGDMIVTRSGGLQPVRWLLKQELPSCGRFAPVLLRAPFFNLTSDIIVAQNQRLVVSNIEAEYDLGIDTVSVEAHHFIGHSGNAALADSVSTTYYQILLDQHDCIRLSGAWVDSLYIGQLAKYPEIVAASGLADMQVADIPLHRELANPTLRPYESRVLLEALTA